MKKRRLPDLVSDWFYDVDAGGAACGKSKGKLCEARASNGYQRLHSYDDKGREHITRTAQDSTQALSTVSVAFDANTGRVQSQTWPTGYTASYSYSEWGYLREVSASGGGAPAARLQILAYDAQGRITQYKQGEKIITDKKYYDATGRLKDVSATLEGQVDPNKLFRQTYEYDSIGNLTKRHDHITGVQDGFVYDTLNRLIYYSTLGGGIATPQTAQVAYDARGNITYKSDVGRYWYDTDRPNRLLHVTLEGQAGLQPLTGTRALSYVFDDHMPGARSNNGLALGNGNLMDTVSHDSASGRHTVRWESYTSFNMPLEIKYTNIGQTQYQSNLGQVIAATAQYKCLEGGNLHGTQCVFISMVSPTQNYSCASGMQLRNGNQCWALIRSGFRSVWRYIATITPTFICPVNTTAVGTGNTMMCQKMHVFDQAKLVGYSCPPNYEMMTGGTQCRGTGGRLVIGQSDAALASSDRTLSFTYGPEHQRVKQVVNLSNNAPTAMMGGTTWYLHGSNNNLLYEREEKANGITEHKHYLQAGGMTFALAVTRSGAGLDAASPDPKRRPTQLSYFQQDHLGSIAAVFDENGFPIEQMAYDPWGKRRFVNGVSDTSDSIVGLTTDRGYTEHEHLDEVGVIHMNGRLYDPLIGRFMSADPYIQSPENLQSYNRYAYVMNNPLAYTDPSGYFSARNFIRYAAFGLFGDNATVRQIQVIGVCYFGGPVMCGGISALNAYVGGATRNEALRSGLIAGLTAGAFEWAGGVAPEGMDPRSVAAAASTERYIAHAIVGCVSAVAGDGNCGSGAAAALFGKWTTNNTRGLDIISRGIVTAVAGGVGAELTGGQFANGAMTAAFGYLFNQMRQSRESTRADRLRTALAELGPEEIPPGIDVNSNIARAQGMSPVEYYDAVKTHGEWDYKQVDRKYENFGNFNFGATCGAITFSNAACSGGAGLYQIKSGTSDPKWGGFFGPSWGDDPNDQQWISRGQLYYRAYQSEFMWNFIPRRRK